MDVERQSPYTGELTIQPPHPNIGRLVFREETEADHTLVASFGEDVVPGLVNKDVSLAFVPTMQEVLLWVSATDQLTVDRVLDEILDTIQSGASRLGVVTRLVSSEDSSETI